VQPKAAGSSVLMKLANSLVLVLDVIRLFGKLGGPSSHHVSVVHDIFC